ncbi:hypothetical protein VOLCADRAFT_99724 [Volvox carteri f. nagariensis]|uniref:Uncharacterized protein n=1 Tax=Volvox carteri f. nagariensis TaxID=3068 RepID=D8UIH2_VOLCA|nr:uncharacterized protein VOLCADRAFT_99724 [Volvox carteri f. nagariensis]EFJ40452.1 hypothetical protein VOLCADRAFT_99724 [Volvox carteri f. nagariensis]|eukprot:XP_002958452.1 hypothetical protein VOLCADRAFT_99724 [Volvox carteri f. nagariensis]
MFSLPRKRRVDDDEEDNEGWRIVYAEDIDERRAELLRRLDLKTSGPAKLVNPWASHGTELPRGAAPELDEDAEGPSPTGSGSGGDGSVYGTDMRDPGIMQGPGSCMTTAHGATGAPTGAAGEMSHMALGGGLRTLRRAASGGQEPERERYAQGRQQQHGGRRGSAPAATAAAAAVAQMDQLLRDLKRSIDGGAGAPGSRDGDGDHSATPGFGMQLACDATMAAAAAPPGDSGHPRGSALLLVHGIDGAEAEDAVVSGLPAARQPVSPAAAATAASPYAALLGSPGGFGSVGRGRNGGGKPCFSASAGQGPLSPRPGFHSSSAHRSTARTGRGGLGALLPPSGGSSALNFSSSQKGKKAKFVIREAPNLAQDASASSLSQGDLAPATQAGTDIAGSGKKGREVALSPAPFRSHSGGSGKLAALLGSGPPPPSSAAAAKPPTISSTPMGRRLHSIAAAPSPLTNNKTPSSATSGGLIGIHTRRVSLNTADAAATTPPTRQGLPRDTPATTVGSVDHGTGPVGMAVTPGTTARGGSSGGGAASVARLQSTPRASNPPASLRELLLPPPPPSRPSTNTTRAVAVGVAVPGPVPPAQREEAHLQLPDAAGEVLHSLGREQGQPAEHLHEQPLPLPPPPSHQPQEQEQQQHGDGNRYGQPLGQRDTRDQPLSLHHHHHHEQQQQQATPPASQHQHQRLQQERANLLELMGQQSHRQREFVQKLGPPAPPSALSAGRRAGSSGRGGAATAVGLQGRLQAVLANLKLSLDREAGAAASGRPQLPTPAGSLLVEVRRRMREAHLTKATCTVRQVYDVCGASTSARSQVALPAQEVAVLPLPRSHPHVGEEVHVFLDSKRGDWGIEPGDSFLVLPPYKVLYVRQKGTGLQQEDPDVCGDGREGPIHGRGMGLARDAGERVSASMGTATLGASGEGLGEEPNLEIGNSGGQLVVLAHLARRYDGTVS